MNRYSTRSSAGTQAKSRIVEIVGPAGAGKTTLSQTLSGCDDIQLLNFPDVRKIASLPFFARYGLQVLSSVTLTHPAGLKELSRRELAWLSILNGWPRTLRQESSKQNDLIVLDQGPVYLLSEMTLSGPCFLKLKRAKDLWRLWYRDWSSVLDAVVWLDAPDECLIERIRTREKDHLVKAKSASESCQFLRAYRRTYEHTFSALAAHRTGFRVLRYDTSRQAPEEIAAELLMVFELETVPCVDF